MGVQQDSIRNTQMYALSLSLSLFINFFNPILGLALGVLIHFVELCFGIYI